jgi:hypothetical protein
MSTRARGQLPPSQYDEWLACRNPEFARAFFRVPLETGMAAYSHVPERRTISLSDPSKVDVFTSGDTGSHPQPGLQ